MRRRRGSVLIISLIVMLVLTILSGAMFGFSYINYRSAEQMEGTFRARVAADSLLYAVADAVIRDKASLHAPFSRAGTLEDGPITAEVNLSAEDKWLYVLKCSAQYGDWKSGERRLDLVRRENESPGGVIEEEWEWIWQ